MMNKTQELGKTIINLMELEAIARIEYDNAEAIAEETYKKVVYWEHLYKESGEAEEVGVVLDKLYNEHYETNQAQTEAYDKLEAIQKVLEHLREAVEIVEEWEL